MGANPDWSRDKRKLINNQESSNSHCRCGFSLRQYHDERENGKQWKYKADKKNVTFYRFIFPYQKPSMYCMEEKYDIFLILSAMSILYLKKISDISSHDIWEFYLSQGRQENSEDWNAILGSKKK